MVDAVIRFPRMNVAIATREGCVSDITYLPSSAPLKVEWIPVPPRFCTLR